MRQKVVNEFKGGSGTPATKTPMSAESDLPVETSGYQDKTPLGQLEELRQDILNAYNEMITVTEAEKLAAKFLHAQMSLSEQLRTKDLDARMKKNGYKTVRAKVYLEEVQKAEKKPTEAQLDAMIATNTTVSSAQDAYEAADVESESLRRYYDIFKDAHIYFRGIAKGKFE